MVDAATRSLERERLLAVNGRVAFFIAFVVAPLVVANLGYQALLQPNWQFKSLTAAAGLLGLLWFVALLFSRRGYLAASAGLTVYAALCFDAFAVAVRQDTFFAATVASVSISVYCWALAPRLIPHVAFFTASSLGVLRVLEHLGRLPSAVPSPYLGIFLDLSILGVALPVVSYVLHWRSKLNNLPYQALARQQRWLEAVIRALPVPLVIADLRTRSVVLASAEGERLLGLGDPEPVSEPATGANAVFASIIERLARGERCEGEELDLTTRSGERATALCSARLLPQLHGRDATALVVMLGVTGLKKAQAELQAALNAREEFLSVASHELRTPLTALALQLDTMIRSSQLHPESIDAEWLSRRVGTLQRQARRLTLLVNGLLDLPRIEGGRIDLAPEPMELGELAAQVALRCEHEARAAGCEVRVEAGTPAHGRWDRCRLDLVLSNLLSNAIKYGAGKPVLVSTGMERGAARVSVVDRGTGITPQELGRLFQRFERLHGFREYPGAGLGLWIARALVERMGGTIEVESAVGEGSRFTVLLPAQTEAPEKRQPRGPASRAASGEVPARSS
ncbi:MAG: ATP-binding protein [Myxococcales bacterium]|jgi:signal transduction histidine kinase